jgi:hypothetical protein
VKTSKHRLQPIDNEVGFDSGDEHIYEQQRVPEAGVLGRAKALLDKEPKKKARSFWP